MLGVAGTIHTLLGGRPPSWAHRRCRGCLKGQRAQVWLEALCFEEMSHYHLQYMEVPTGRFGYCAADLWPLMRLCLTAAPQHWQAVLRYHTLLDRLVSADARFLCNLSDIFFVFQVRGRKGKPLCAGAHGRSRASRPASACVPARRTPFRKWQPPLTGTTPSPPLLGVLIAAEPCHKGNPNVPRSGERRLMCH
jgi:hypothetical protein